MGSEGLFDGLFDGLLDGLFDELLDGLQGNIRLLARDLKAWWPWRGFVCLYVVAVTHARSFSTGWGLGSPLS